MSKNNFKMWLMPALVSGIVCFGTMTDGVAGVNINIGTPDLNISIGTPPPVVIQSPPPMAVIPGTYVYMAPDVGTDILFYHGFWYRPHGGHWFSAPSYNGPWAHVVPARVPKPILDLPPGYHRLPPGHQRIPYEHVKGNWQKWEREKKWHHDRTWQVGHHEDAGRGHDGQGKHGRKD